MDYELYGIVPDEPIGVMAYQMAKPLIDRRNRNYENGKQGGRPKNPNLTEQKPTDNRTVTETKPKRIKDKGERIKDKEKDILSGVNAPEYPYKEVVEYLNQKCGTRFKDRSKDTRAHIRARCEEGATLDDFKEVIDNRCAAWKNDPKMSEFLRPSTLFGPKFESYLNAKPGKKTNKFVNFQGRDYDFDALERALTGVNA